MSNSMSTLGVELPEEQARVRQLLIQYHEIGPNGAFGAMMIEQALAEADRAAVSGNVQKMLQALHKLQKLE